MTTSTSRNDKKRDRPRLSQSNPVCISIPPVICGFVMVLVIVLCELPLLVMHVGLSRTPFLACASYPPLFVDPPPPPAGISASASIGPLFFASPLSYRSSSRRPSTKGRAFALSTYRSSQDKLPFYGTDPIGSPTFHQASIRLAAHQAGKLPSSPVGSSVVQQCP